MWNTTTVAISFFAVLAIVAWIGRPKMQARFERFMRKVGESPAKLEAVIATIPKDKRNARTALGAWFQIWRAWRKFER